MDASGGLYSSFVGWVKIILPVAALGLLSTLFLFARAPASQTDVPFAKIAELAAEQRITAPRFSGITDDGSVIAVSARNAKPDMERPKTLLAEDLAISLDSPTGGRLDITSGMSVLDGNAQTARLDGLARLSTSTGYTMETVGLTADLQTGEVVSDGVLEIQAPFGSITAGRVQITASRENTGQQMVFTDGVRLLYTPQVD